MAAVEGETGQEMNDVNLLALRFLYSNTDAPHSSSSGRTPLSSSLAAKLAPQGPASMEQMRAELREIRDELDTLKTQHKKETKLLMNDLDEEKMRLSLQTEVERLEKHTSK